MKPSNAATPGRVVAEPGVEHTAESYMAAWNALSAEDRAKAAVGSDSSTSGGAYLVTTSGVVFGAFSNA